MNGMGLNIFRDLDPAEIKDFVQWALDNWKPDTPPKEVWHPVIRNTWMILDAAFETTKRQVLADLK